MLIVRSMPILRTWIRACQSHRVLSSCIALPSIDVHRPVLHRRQQISWFSSSTVIHARRSNKDPVDINASEEYTNEEKNKDDGDDDDDDGPAADQVMFVSQDRVTQCSSMESRLVFSLERTGDDSEASRTIQTA